MITPTALLVERLDRPIGIWTVRPRFSWRLDAQGASSVVQVGYEIEIREAGGGIVGATGPVSSRDLALVEVGGFVARSATEYSWRVRVWLQGRPEPTEWADSTFETSLLHEGDWDAQWIEPTQEPVRPDGAADFRSLATTRLGSPDERLLPTPWVRQRFHIDEKPVSARLYATAHGIYEGEINGLAISDEVLAPGNESYEAFLSFQVHDVTDLLRQGENVVGFVLSDGWWAGRPGILGTSGAFGTRLQLLWQLRLADAEGRVRVLSSDGTAVSSTDGPIRYADLAVGERHDARVAWSGWSMPELDDSSWEPVSVVFPEQRLVPFAGEPVRRVLELPAQRILRTPSGDSVVDFGQVIAGRTRIRVAGERGRVVTLEHSELLDARGDFVQTILGPNKDQTDVYVLAGDADGEVWEPRFTVHGFRYVRVTGLDGPLDPGDFTAVVISSDLPVIARLATSDSRLNRLHDNVRWSQRGNFLSIPTDCPQRERYGWTGDLQVFAPTAATNMSVGPFLSRWLASVRADQLPDGRIINISPDPPGLRFLRDGPPPSYDDPIMLLASSAGWGDVIAIAPSVLHAAFEDRRVLEENYDAMSAWVEYQIRSAESGVSRHLVGQVLTDEQRARQSLLWNNEPNFGDWLAPSTLRGEGGGQMVAPRRTGEVIGSLFHGHVLRLVSDVATVLGRAADAARYGERAARVRAAFAEEYIRSDGSIPGDMQGLYVLALAFDFVPPAAEQQVVDRLVTLIHEAGDHLDTGFLSVPYLLDVLWDHGHRDLARTLLLQDTAPSWLYEVAMGATTVWEGWEAIAPDGTVTDLSYNHYAFGCVDDWMYRRLAGLQRVAPGYRESRIEPDAVGELDEVDAAIETPYGTLASHWRRDADGVRLDVVVPPNTTSTVVAPAGARIVRVEHPAAGAGDGARVELGSGSGSIWFTATGP
ncbi:MAG: family 78 glycoside hydrolase catalytic domain [Pseudolysinimonas sp.]